MIVSKDNFPVVLQAYEIQNNREVFIAEQVVNNQTEVDTFTARFAGKLIKAKQFTADGVNKSSTHSNARRRGVSIPVIILIVLIILVALVVIGFSTGWIQENLGITI